MGINLKDLTKDPKVFNNQEVKGDVIIEEPEEKTPGVIKRAGDRYERHLENKARKEMDNQDEVFQELQEDSQTTMKSNGAFMAIVPILSGVITPAILMFSLGLQEDQLAIIRAVLISNLITMVLTAIFSNINLWDAVKKTTRNSYRASKAKFELLVSKKENKIVELETEVKHLKNTLLSYNERQEELDEEMEELREIKYERDLENAVEARVKTVQPSRPQHQPPKRVR